MQEIDNKNKSSLAIIADALDEQQQNRWLAEKKYVQKFLKDSKHSKVMKIAYKISYNERFRIDYEGYEVFCCKEALKIAAACGTPEKIEEFRKAKWEEQKSMVSDLSEGHSGNSFGCATQLAYIHLKWPERIH